MTTASNDLHPDDPAMAALDRLVGTWNITGEATGRVTLRWLPGGGFLHQEGHLDFNGHRNEFVELIGRAQPPGAAQPGDITSRVYTGAGQMLDYTHELADDEVTIWYGHRGSDNCYRGTFNSEGTVLDGAWSWPGGGYATTASRIDS